ncbi:MAG: pinensin family lanthipeptide [Cyclobacteriaceae bacterium]
MKKKLTLNDLKIQSFVTQTSDFNLQTVKGGAAPDNGGGAERAGRTVKWFCGGDEPDGGETVLNICETVYYKC